MSEFLMKIVSRKGKLIFDKNVEPNVLVKYFPQIKLLNFF